MDSNGLVELETHQVEKSSFPPKCPVYVYDDQVPPTCIGHGSVSRVLLQYLPSVEMFYEVEMGSSKRVCKMPNIRFRNGCPVNVKFHDERGSGKGNDETFEGIVLGVCDIPHDPTGRRNHTNDIFWYSVQLLGSRSRSILHEISPSKVSYRLSRIKVEEEPENIRAEEEAVPVDEERSRINATVEEYFPVKIENDDSVDDIPDTVVLCMEVDRNTTDNALESSDWRYQKPGSQEVDSKVVSGPGHSESSHRKWDTNDGKNHEKNSLHSVDHITPRDSSSCGSGKRACEATAQSPKSRQLRNHNQKGVNNPHYQSALFEEICTEKNVVKVLKQEIDIPVSFFDKNIPMCISYHVRGKCQSTCKSAIDHGKVPNLKLLSFQRWCETKLRGNDHHTSEQEEGSQTVQHEYRNSKRRRLSNDLLKGQSKAQNDSSDERRNKGQKDERGNIKPKVVKNPSHQSSIFKEIYATKNSINLLKNESDIPMSVFDKETPICLFYHIKGVCSSNCKRAIDHAQIPKDKLHSFRRWCEMKLWTCKGADSKGYVTYKITDIPESKYQRAKQSFLIGEGGSCHRKIQDATGCLVHYHSKEILVKDSDPARAENGARHILKTMQQFFDEKLTEVRIRAPDNR